MSAVAEARRAGEEFAPEPTNDAEPDIVVQAPLSLEFTLEGSSNLLFHRWSNEAVAEKAAAAKNSKAKKEDNLESYVYRNDEGEICLPGEYVRMSMVNAAKFFQDPRSSRKSAMDLMKAALVSLTEYAPIMVGEGEDRRPTKDWDFLDQRRVTIQRSAITRSRPGFLPGWQASFAFQVVLPEYVSRKWFHEILTMAGRVVGVGDFRPTHGRFIVARFEEVAFAV